MHVVIIKVQNVFDILKSKLLKITKKRGGQMRTTHELTFWNRRPPTTMGAGDARSIPHLTH